MSPTSRVQILLAALLCAGCSDTSQPSHAALSAVDARAALVAMVESTDNVAHKMSLDFLRSEKAEVKENGEMSIGAWRVNLERRTFVVAVDTEAFFEEYGGVFEPDEGNRWRAVITHEAHGTTR